MTVVPVCEFGRISFCDGAFIMLVLAKSFCENDQLRIGNIKLAIVCSSAFVKIIINVICSSK